MRSLHTKISGWGRYPVAECDLYRPERRADLHAWGDRCIARGRGRSYGDAALNDRGGVVLTERIDRFLEFDREHGLLRAEAGLSLDEILAVIVPQGWFLPVVPGTRFVSLGGCIAADVHGKNQHRAGNFGSFVRELELVLADGSQVRCGPDQDAALFRATVGGMGLTGIISEATIRLIPVDSAYLEVEYRRGADLDAVLSLLEADEWDDHYTVAWLDCLATGGELGRGVVSRAHHADRAALRETDAEPLRLRPAPVRNLPLDFPSWVLNPWSIRAFNRLYYRRHAALDKPRITDYRSHFFPLDRIGRWNRMYGKRGFVQYQCVLPPARTRQDLRTMLELLSDSRLPSFLAVLKRFGSQGNGMLSFPMPGHTLALDIPLRNDDVFRLLRRLDEIVLAAGGRVYLAKDARLDPQTFLAMYPRYREWLEVKRRVDPGNRFTSGLARRLKIGAEA